MYLKCTHFLPELRHDITFSRLAMLLSDAIFIFQLFCRQKRQLLLNFEFWKCKESHPISSKAKTGTRTPTHPIRLRLNDRYGWVEIYMCTYSHPYHPSHDITRLKLHDKEEWVGDRGLRTPPSIPYLPMFALNQWQISLNMNNMPTYVLCWRNFS